MTVDLDALEKLAEEMERLSEESITNLPHLDFARGRASGKAQGYKRSADLVRAFLAKAQRAE